MVPGAGLGPACPGFKDRAGCRQPTPDRAGASTVCHPQLADLQGPPARWSQRQVIGSALPSGRLGRLELSGPDPDRRATAGFSPSVRSPGLEPGRPSRSISTSD